MSLDLEALRSANWTPESGFGRCLAWPGVGLVPAGLPRRVHSFNDESLLVSNFRLT